MFKQNKKQLDNVRIEPKTSAEVRATSYYKLSCKASIIPHIPVKIEPQRNQNPFKLKLVKTTASSQ